MKNSVITTTSLFLLGTRFVHGFVVTPHRTSYNNAAVLSTNNILTLNMFGGGGTASAPEDDPEGEERVKKAAASMGLPVAEYKMAMQAQERLKNAMDSKMVNSGNEDTVYVERDVNNPPKKLDISITEKGKALGKEEVSKQLVSALKNVSENSRKGRMEVQKDMIEWIRTQAPKA